MFNSDTDGLFAVAGGMQIGCGFGEGTELGEDYIENGFVVVEEFDGKASQVEG